MNPKERLFGEKGYCKYGEAIGEMRDLRDKQDLAHACNPKVIVSLYSLTGRAESGPGSVLPSTLVPSPSLPLFAAVQFQMKRFKGHSPVWKRWPVAANEVSTHHATYRHSGWKQRSHYSANRNRNRAR